MTELWHDDSHDETDQDWGEADGEPEFPPEPDDAAVRGRPLADSILSDIAERGTVDVIPEL